MSLMQAILIGFVCAAATIEGGWLGECKLREPVVTGCLVGLILGDVQKGLIIGAQLQLIWMGVAAIGPVAGLNIGAGGTIGTAIALSTGAGIEVAMTFGVPVSILMQFVGTFFGTLFSGLMHVADRMIDEGGKEKMLIAIHFLPGIIDIIRDVLITTTVLYFGSEIITAIVNGLPAWASNGLNAVALVLPALGFAMLLNLLLETDLIPFFIIGFVLAAYLGISMIGVAAISIAIAWVYYILKRDNVSGSKLEVEEEEL